MAKVKSVEVESVNLELPIAEIDPTAYRQQHVDIRLDDVQARALKRLLEGMKRDNARLKSGRVVFTPPEAVKFILEQVT